MDEWYFTVTSEEYGSEEYGGYSSEAEALAGIKRIKAKAAELNDGISRIYSEPYTKGGEPCQQQQV
jgi:hypothetical protein